MFDAFATALDSSALSEQPLGWALLAMFSLALLASTVLPLGSEAAFVLLLHTHPDWQGSLWLAATLGNSLGSLITYGMGRAAHRLLQQGQAPRLNPRAIAWLQRYGPAACVLGWLPVVGDALCAMAGWLRLPLHACALWITLGKGARYAALLLVGA